MPIKTVRKIILELDFLDLSEVSSRKYNTFLFLLH